jgi:group I intron endonuclease
VKLRNTSSTKRQNAVALVLRCMKLNFMSKTGKSGTVYLILNTRNMKVYIGQTSTGLVKRWGHHTLDARRGAASRIAAAIREYGKESFAIYELARGTCGENLDEIEKQMILRHRSTNPEFGYNISEDSKWRMFGDANPNFGTRLSEEERAARGRAIAEGLKRRKEQGLPIRKAPHRVVTPFLPGNKFGCFPKSEEHRRKISEAQRRHWESVRVG